MNDTYAVVNKPKQPHLSAPGGGSRTFPATHHYDNDPTGAPTAPIYSTVKPRAKQLSQSLSASPIYDLAAPTNHKPTEGADLLTAAAADDNDDYEDVSSSVPDMTSFCSPGGIGFNCRVRKPRGPRDPPAEWSRLER